MSNERKPLFLNPIGDSEWDAQCDGIDYHLSANKDGNWVVDEFADVREPVDGGCHVVRSLSFDDFRSVIEHISRR